MGGIRVALTDKEVKATKPGTKAFKLADGGGLHLLVTPAGGKPWRMKYRFGYREKQLALGRHADVSLADAREGRDAAKAALRKCQDPGFVKKFGPAPAENFEAAAREWHARTKARWTDRHAADVLTSLERLVFRALGACPRIGQTTGGGI
jgi:Arm DNA-binding domain